MKRAITAIWTIMASIIAFPVWMIVLIFLLTDLFSKDHHNYQKRM